MKKFSKIFVNSIIFVTGMIIASAVGLVICVVLDSYGLIKVHVQDNEVLIHMIWWVSVSLLVYYLLSYITDRYKRYIEVNCLKKANKTLRNCDIDGIIFAGRELSEKQKKILLDGINIKSIKQK